MIVRRNCSYLARYLYACMQLLLLEIIVRIHRNVNGEIGSVFLKAFLLWCPDIFADACTCKSSPRPRADSTTGFTETTGVGALIAMSDLFIDCLPLSPPTSPWYPSRPYPSPTAQLAPTSTRLPFFLIRMILLESMGQATVATRCPIDEGAEQPAQQKRAFVPYKCQRPEGAAWRFVGCLARISALCTLSRPETPLM